MREDVGHELHAHPHGEADGKHEHRLAVELGGGDDAHARRSHGAKHQKRRPAKHAIGDKGEKLAHDGEEPQEEQGGGDEVAHIAACHARELYHAIVLGKYRVGETVEDGCQHGVEAVCQDAALRTSHEHGTFHRLAGDEGVGGDVAESLNSGDEIDKAQPNDGAYVESQAILEGDWNVERAFCTDVGEIDHAQAISRHAANEQAQHYRPHAQELVARPVEEDYGDEHQHRQAQVLQGAEGAIVHCRLAASTRGYARLDETQAYERDHDASHKRRDDLARVGQDATHDHLNRGCHEAPAKDIAQPQRHVHLAIDHAQHAGADDRTDKRERRALNAKQPRADGSDAAALDESGDAGDEERHRHEIASGLDVEAQGGGYDKRWSDDGHEYGQEVLHGGKKGLAERRTVV